jgi:hypothetical protein
LFLRIFGRGRIGGTSGHRRGLSEGEQPLYRVFGLYVRPFSPAIDSRDRSLDGDCGTIWMG